MMDESTPAPARTLDSCRYLATAAAVLMVAVWLGGEPLASWLRYDRAAVFEGELWRLLTSHVTHTSGQHLAFNLLGLLAIAVLFPDHYTARLWLLIAGASSASLALGFLVLEPSLTWYVGASGVLHGLLAAGAVAWWFRERRALALALTVILLAKLGWEQRYGALPLAADLPVIVDAHLYGSAGGAVAGVVIMLRKRSR